MWDASDTDARSVSESPPRFRSQRDPTETEGKDPNGNGTAFTRDTTSWDGGRDQEDRQPFLLERLKESKTLNLLGTLGVGNHFLELLYEEGGRDGYG